MTTSWRHGDGDHDDGDHGVMPVTGWSWSPEDEDQRSYMILAISCHYTIWLHVMFIMFMHLVYLGRRSSIRWSLTKFQAVFSPNCALLLQFVASKHHVMIGCDRSLRSHTTGVRQIYTCNTLRVNLTSLACTDMASEHGDRKLEHESYSRYDQHEDVHRWWLVRLTWWSDTA